MGNFSYLYSDYNEYPNSKAGIEENDGVVLLIPKEFGGGNIIGKYDGYGNIISGKEKYSVGAINAIWNYERIRRILETDFGITGKLGIELNSDENLELFESLRYFGSLINDEIAVRLEYPVKIVRKKENIKKYEDYEFACIWDCDQGWSDDDAFDEKRNIKPFGGYLKYIEYLKSVPIDDMIIENEISYGIFLDKARELKNGELKAKNVSKEDYYIDTLETRINRKRLRTEFLLESENFDAGHAIASYSEFQQDMLEKIERTLLSVKFATFELNKKGIGEKADEAMLEVKSIKREMVLLLNKIKNKTYSF
jgi:hypothetical protein